MKSFIIIALFFLSTFSFIACDKDPLDPPETTVTEALAGGDFEVWTTQTQGEVSFDKPSGDWWDGLNYLSVIGGPITVTKTTDSYSGSYALRLETKWWGEDLTIPGILASGYFNPDLPIGENLVIGKPFTKKPSKLNGYFKYFPADNDTLVIFITLTKYNGTNEVRDTIAKGEYTYSGEINSYSPFSVNIDYLINTIPDSVHVILLSSVSGKEMKGHAGSVLFIDKLNFEYE
ncbi:MAG TPA: PCMD domain-containing protein [Bacteroidales bacterium]|nr:PCMD domain-containing protein [Bacteroidales bacterium]